MQRRHVSVVPCFSRDYMPLNRCVVQVGSATVGELKSELLANLLLSQCGYVSGNTSLAAKHYEGFITTGRVHVPQNSLCESGEYFILHPDSGMPPLECIVLVIKHE